MKTLSNNPNLYYWSKELSDLVRRLNYARKYDRMTIDLYRRFVKNCLWHYWYHGGIGGNPSNAAKYFPTRDNSTIC